MVSLGVVDTAGVVSKHVGESTEKLDAAKLEAMLEDPHDLSRVVSGQVLAGEVARLSRLAGQMDVSDPKRVEIIARFQDAKRRKQVHDESGAKDLPYYLPGLRSCISEESHLARALSEAGRGDDAMLATIRVKVMKKEEKEIQEALMKRMEEIQAKLSLINEKEMSLDRITKMEEDQRRLKQEAAELIPVDEDSDQSPTHQTEGGEKVKLSKGQKKKLRKQRQKGMTAETAADNAPGPGRVTADSVVSALDDNDMPDMVKELARTLAQDPTVLKQLHETGELDDVLMEDVTRRSCQQMAAAAPDAKSAAILKQLNLDDDSHYPHSQPQNTDKSQGMPGTSLSEEGMPQEVTSPTARQRAAAKAKEQLRVIRGEDSDEHEEAVQSKRDLLKEKMARKQQRYAELQAARKNRGNDKDLFEKAMARNAAAEKAEQLVAAEAEKTEQAAQIDIAPPVFVPGPAPDLELD